MNHARKQAQVHGQNIIACVWDFDKTLIPGYMQTPLFEHYGIDENLFWKEVNSLPEVYAKRGLRVSADTIYLNHLLSYVKNGPLRGLTNEKLVELGAELEFCHGLPEFFGELSKIPLTDEFSQYDFRLEHYIISTGLTHVVRGSKIAPFVEDIFACEFIESPLPPYFSRRTELFLPLEPEITQIGMVVDNTIKTRYIFEINKGSNKNPGIEVNSALPHEDRRVPIDQMIYVADGPSDVPVFAVLKQWGGRTYAVYDPDNEKEFKQTCRLVETGRVHNNGPADYRSPSPTSRWLKHKVLEICREMVLKRENALRSRSTNPPHHLPREEDSGESINPPQQETLFD
ncbi:MAG: haloacid dehalogenase-like hydrolase [Opitutae bacterium]|nr:haloacid dehalogenase-like hydrolase [Opitutae bacterium]